MVQARRRHGHLAATSGLGSGHNGLVRHATALWRYRSSREDPTADDTKLVYIRRPITRAIIHYAAGMGWASLDFDAGFVRNPCFLDGVRYAYQLEPRLEAFGRNTFSRSRSSTPSPTARMSHPASPPSWALTRRCAKAPQVSSQTGPISFTPPASRPNHVPSHPGRLFGSA